MQAAFGVSNKCLKDHKILHFSLNLTTNELVYLTDQITLMINDYNYRLLHPPPSLTVTSSGIKSGMYGESSHSLTHSLTYTHTLTLTHTKSVPPTCASTQCLGQCMDAFWRV